MTISLILKLSPQAVADGRLAGHVEIVATGECKVIRDADELLRFVQRSPRPAPETSEPMPCPDAAV